MQAAYSAITTAATRPVIIVRERLEKANATIAAKDAEIAALRDELAKLNRRLHYREQDLADANASVLRIAENLSETKRELARIKGEYNHEYFTDDEIKVRRPLHDICEDVLKDFPGVTMADVFSVRRQRHLTDARHACICAAYIERPDLSLPNLGRFFKRDHTTIIHAAQKAGIHEPRK